MKPTGFALAALASATLLGGVAQAADSPLMIRVGVHAIEPKSDNGSILGGAAAVDVDGSVGPTLNINYAFTPNLVLDVLGALPFKHDISLNGQKAGSAKHLPPTVSLQYHFLPGGRVDPYIGAGLNYTMFWEDKLDGEGSPGLELENSWGFAGQIGVDFALGAGNRWVLGVDVRYMDIDTDVKVDGSKVGTVNIDPIAYGMNLGYRF